MSRALDDLDPEFLPLAAMLIARCIEAGIPLMIIDTLRTPEEQAENLAKGTSWTLKSRHLPRPCPDDCPHKNEPTCPDPAPRKSRAIDLCPFLQYDLYGTDKLQWNANDPVWQKMGAVAKKIKGLKSGVWLPDKNGVLQNVDPGHFEIQESN